MPTNPNKLSQFWQELKRRNVVRVITVYAGAAFVLLELVDIIAEPLKLPIWLLPVVIVLLSIGFIIAVILSWIYDVHPEGGIVKTEPNEKVEVKDIPKSPNSWKIATYLCGIIIIGLLVFNIFGNSKKVQIDESLEKSIAVLPFQNFSTDPDQDVMCLGLTDEIINHLYKIESFDKVSSLTSVLNYRHPERNISEIAKDLGVNYILEGVYKKIGDQLSVSAQLIEPKHDKHIWQQNYVQPYEEIIAIQSNIALQIADHLKAFLTVSEKENIQKVPTISQEAYELYQRGLYLYNTRGAESYSEVFDIALEAIRLDPDYADAYAWGGVFALWNGNYAGETDIQHASMDALPFIEKALELDQNNAMAHLGMGFVNEFARWDYIRAEKEYQRTIDLEPNNLMYYDAAIEFSLKMGQIENVLKLSDKVLGFRNSYFAIINGLTLSDNKKEAYNLLAQASDSEMAHPLIGEAYIWIEEYDSALFYLESALQAKHYTMPLPRFQAKLAYAYEKTNNHLKARTIVNQLMAKSDTTSLGSPAYFTSWYYSRMGDLDSAFFWMEKAYDNRSPEMPWLKIDPAFNSLKKDDRYWDLYERTGHKAYDDYQASKQQ